LLDTPSALEDAIRETWSDVGGSAKRQYSGWVRIPEADEWWVTSRTTKTKECDSQVVHFHLLEGHLLVDGKPLGRLPLEMTNDEGVREIFGKQHLLIRPSSMDGMEYQLTNVISNHEIHFGMNQGRVIIRAKFHQSLLEYIPREIFGDSSMTDLPSSLIDDCIHWLNLNTGELECRRKPKIWQQKKSNWIVDVRKRTATRNKGSTRSGLEGQSAQRQRGRGSCLVEPRSSIGQQISNIFRGFEDADKITVYQPTSRGNLAVEMKRLEIRFHVNSHGRLECRQLKSEIDPIQDAGTLYGLSSKVVLRSLKNPLRKSILVPRGQFSWELRGMHVKVTIANRGTYARFTIDPVLGRLTCAPEPRLLYMKAALHALTSFPIPDPLTQRTGTEEAQECLRAASSQHWNPLDPVALDMLSVIRSLAPERSYYPWGQKLYQKVSWIEGLTMTVQSEGLIAHVDFIRRESEKLKRLQPPQPGSEVASMVSTSSPVHGEDPGNCHCDACHLRFRGLIRRQLYERLPEGSAFFAQEMATSWHVPRDRGFQSQHSTQVYRTILALFHGRIDEDSLDIPHLTPLVSLLKGVENIGGFPENYASIPLDIQLTLDSSLLDSWGSHIQICRFSGPNRSYDAVFLLGLLAFGHRSDMRWLRWLLSIACKKSLQLIEPPLHLSFADFQPFQEPSMDLLVNLILCNQPGQNGMQPKKNRHQNIDALKDKQKGEAEQVAALLIAQWPEVPESLMELEKIIEHLVLEVLDLQRIWDLLHKQLQRLSQNYELSEYLKHIETAARTAHLKDGKPEEAAGIWKMIPRSLFNVDAISRGGSDYSLPRLANGLAMKSYDTLDLSTAQSLAPTSTKRLSTIPVGGTVRQLHADIDHSSTVPLPEEISILSGIVDHFKSSSNATRRQYGLDLQESLDALIEDRKKPRSAEEMPTLNEATVEVARERSAVIDQFNSIYKALCRGEPGHSWLLAGNLLPCISPLTILALIRQDQKSSISPGMRDAIVQYGIRITKLQRLLRMRDAQLCQDDKRFTVDKQNEGHSNWEPMDHPDWLLIEIDSDMLIREAQVDVARAIISPLSQQNSVLQMNMGEGVCAQASRRSEKALWSFLLTLYQPR